MVPVPLLLPVWSVMAVSDALAVGLEPPETTQVPG